MFSQEEQTLWLCFVKVNSSLCIGSNLFYFLLFWEELLLWLAYVLLKSPVRLCF